MATPGICKGFGKAAVGIIGGIAMGFGLMVFFFYGAGGPVSGMILGIALGLMSSYQSNQTGEKRSMSTAGAIVGLCAGVVAREFGGAPGAIFGAFTMLIVSFVMLPILAQLFEKTA